MPIGMRTNICARDAADILPRQLTSYLDGHADSHADWSNRMKVRIGFVTNSSSTNFVVGIKDSLTKEKVLKALGINDTSPLFPLANDVAQFIVDEAEPYPLEETLADYGCETFEDLPDSPYWEIVKKVLRQGWTLLRGDAGLNEGELAETIVSNLGLVYEDDELFLETGRM